MGKQFKRKPTNKKIIPPLAVEHADKQLKKRARHIEAADVGQPGKYIRIDLKKIYRWCVYGMNNREIAESLDVKESTFNAWCRKNSKTYKPELAAAIDRGRRDVFTKIADRLAARAMGYKHKATKFFYDAQEGKVVKQDYIQHYPPSETAATFILKNRRPQDWKDKPVEDLNPEILSGGTHVTVVTDKDKIAELLKRKKEQQGNK